MKKQLFITIVGTLILFLLAIAYRHYKKPYRGLVYSSEVYESQNNDKLKRADLVTTKLSPGFTMVSKFGTTMKIFRNRKLVAKKTGDSLTVIDCQATVETLIELIEKQNSK